MARRQQAFVYRHPFVTLGVVLAVEVVLIAALHLLLGWSPLAVATAGLVALLLVALLAG